MTGRKFFVGHMRYFAVVLSVASVAVAGCSAFYEPKPHETHLNRESALSSTASLAHTFVINKKTSFVTCMQPQPDAAFSQGSSDAFSLQILNFGTGNDKLGASEKSQEIELTGRTPAVLMARELFFRMCEFSRNNELDKAEATELYDKTLDIVKQVWSVEAGNTKVTIGESDAKSIGQSVTDAAPSVPSTTDSSGSTGSSTTGTEESEVESEAESTDSTDSAN